MPFVTKEQRASKATLRELEASHGRVAVIFDDCYQGEYEDDAPAGAVAWEIVVRKARAGEWKLFRKQATSEGSQADANEWLTRTCVVRVAGASEGADPREALDRLLEDWPGIPERVGGVIAKLSGFDMAKRGNG